MGTVPVQDVRYKPDIEPVKAGELRKAIEKMGEDQALIIERWDPVWGLVRYMVVRPTSISALSERIYVVFVATPLRKDYKPAIPFYHKKVRWGLAVATTSAGEVVAFCARAFNDDSMVPVRYYPYDIARER
jgi:hypothetical protein